MFREEPPADAPPAPPPQPGPPRPSQEPEARSTELIVPDSWFAGPKPTGPGESAAGPHAPAGPAYQPHPPGPAQRPAGGEPVSKPLLIGVAALVTMALLAVVFVAWPDGGEKAQADPSNTPVNASGEPSADPSSKRQAIARQRAVAVNQLLKASGATRAELGRALHAARNCKRLPQAVAKMERVAQQRRQQFRQARSLKVGTLPRGRRMRSTLTRAMRLSLDVDLAYLAWARKANGCKGRPKQDAHSRRGATLSNDASAAKQRFAQMWAPVARQHQLPVRSATQF